jgi:hypothetical protein
VVAAVPAALKPLIATMDNVTVLDESAARPTVDFHCPIMSLPLAFGSELATIPANVPYLRASPDRVAHWRQRLPTTAGPRVGLVWAGSAGFEGDRRRSMPFVALNAKLGRLVANSGITFVGLQRDIPARDVAAVGEARDFLNIGSELRDFADTAAVVSLLDLVIGVDTAVVHLAGAMAKPVWIMLPFSPDFRWLLDRTDSPWYPTARLFRQPAPRRLDECHRPHRRRARKHCLRSRPMKKPRRHDHGRVAVAGALETANGLPVRRAGGGGECLSGGAGARRPPTRTRSARLGMVLHAQGTAPGGRGAPRRLRQGQPAQCRHPVQPRHGAGRTRAARRSAGGL